MKTLFGLILVGLLFVSSLGYVANRVQNPDFLVEQTREANLYGRLTGQLGEVLPKDFVKEFPLNQDETEELVKQAVPADEFYAFLKVYATGYLDYWHKRSDQISINYPLTGVKDRAKTGLVAKLKIKYNRLPTCDAEQTRKWDLSSGFPNCRLADGAISDESVDQQLNTLVASSLGELPDAITVSGEPTEQQIANRNLVATANTAIKACWIATLLVVLLMLIAWRRRAFIALAVSLLFVGLVQIGFSLVAWDWIAQNIGDALAGSESGQLAPLALDAVGAALEVLKTALGNLTIIFIGTGGALLVLGIVGAIRGRQEIKLPS